VDLFILRAVKSRPLPGVTGTLTAATVASYHSKLALYQARILESLSTEVEAQQRAVDINVRRFLIPPFQANATR